MVLQTVKRFSSSRLIPACILMACISSGYVGADSIFERRYLFEKLDQFWNRTIGEQAPDASWFAGLSDGSTQASLVVDLEATPLLNLPFDGLLIGDDQQQENQGSTLKGFPVVRLPREHAKQLYKRMAQLELYLQRYRYFERSATDTQEALNLLRTRQLSATVELYLSYLTLYFAEGDFTRKCQRLRRARELEPLTLAVTAIDQLPLAWQPLHSVLLASRQRFHEDTLSVLVCQVQPARTRGETEKLIKMRVEALVSQRVEEKINETLIALNTARAGFQSLINDMDVQIATADIIDLERVLGDVKANLMMVKEDQLQADVLIDQLQSVDLSSLHSPDDLVEYETAHHRMQAMAAAIVDVLESVSALSELTTDSIGEPIGTPFAEHCSGLAQPYRELDFSRNTSELAGTVLERYENCLLTASEMIERFREPSRFKALMAVLSAHVLQLSQVLVQQGN